MLLNVRSVTPLILKPAIVLLALFVFGFGLEARLSQYKPSPPNPTAAKVSTGKRSEQVLRALDKHDEPPHLIDRLVFAFFLSGIRIHPIHQELSKQVEIGLSNPIKLDLNDVYSLHGPPSTLL